MTLKEEQEEYVREVTLTPKGCGSGVPQWDGEAPQTAPQHVPSSPPPTGRAAQWQEGGGGGGRIWDPRLHGRMSASCPTPTGGAHGAGFVNDTPLLQGIQWTPVEFFDNSIICDLIENVSSCPQRGVSTS